MVIKKNVGPRGDLAKDVLKAIKKGHFAVLSHTSVVDYYQLIMLLKRHNRLPNDEKWVVNLAYTLACRQIGRLITMSNGTISFPNMEIMCFIKEHLKSVAAISLFTKYIINECTSMLHTLIKFTPCEGPDHENNMKVLHEVASLLSGKWSGHHSEEQDLKMRLEQPLVRAETIVLDELTIDDIAKVLGGDTDENA